MSGTLPVIGNKPSGFSLTIQTNVAKQIHLLVQTRTPPVFGSIVLANGSAIFSGNGGPTNVSYYVLMTTNLAWPASNWTRIATNQFSATGGFNYTTVFDSNSSQGFFRLQLP